LWPLRVMGRWKIMASTSQHLSKTGTADFYAKFMEAREGRRKEAEKKPGREQPQLRVEH